MSNVDPVILAMAKSAYREWNLCLDQPEWSDASGMARAKWINVATAMRLAGIEGEVRRRVDALRREKIDREILIGIEHQRVEPKPSSHVIAFRGCCADARSES